MRFIILFVVVFVPTLLFGAVQVKDGKMTADLNSESLNSVLDQLKQQTGMKISVEPAVASQSISASFQNLPLALGIKKLLEGTGINYVLIDEDGQTSLFIGNSEKPGAPQVLDSRTVMPGRGLVQPVNPMPPVPAPTEAERTPAQRQTQTPPGTIPPLTVPTGGGFMPNNGNTNVDPNNPNQQPSGAIQTLPEEQAPENEEDQQEQ